MDIAMLKIRSKDLDQIPQFAMQWADTSYKELKQALSQNQEWQAYPTLHEKIRKALIIFGANIYRSATGKLSADESRDAIFHQAINSRFNITEFSDAVHYDILDPKGILLNPNISPATHLLVAKILHLHHIRQLNKERSQTLNDIPSGTCIPIPQQYIENKTYECKVHGYENMRLYNLDKWYHLQLEGLLLNHCIMYANKTYKYEILINPDTNLPTTLILSLSTYGPPQTLSSLSHHDRRDLQIELIDNPHISMLSTERMPCVTISVNIATARIEEVKLFGNEGRSLTWGSANPLFDPVMQAIRDINDKFTQNYGRPLRSFGIDFCGMVDANKVLTLRGNVTLEQVSPSDTIIAGDIKTTQDILGDSTMLGKLIYLAERNENIKINFDSGNIQDGASAKQAASHFTHVAGTIQNNASYTLEFINLVRCGNIYASNCQTLMAPELTHLRHSLDVSCAKYIYIPNLIEIGGHCIINECTELPANLRRIGGDLMLIGNGKNAKTGPGKPILKPTVTLMSDNLEIVAGRIVAPNATVINLPHLRIAAELNINNARLLNIPQLQYCDIIVRDIKSLKQINTSNRCLGCKFYVHEFGHLMPQRFNSLDSFLSAHKHIKVMDV